MRTFPYRAAPLALAALLASGAVVTGAAPAAAHAGVSASDARALAENVTLTFTSEAESKDAGIARLQVVLPPGLSLGAVKFGKAPKGWRFSYAQGSYVLTGKPLPVGTDAVHTIRLRQLPDARRVVFKTVETYSDGEVARWIEEPGTDGDHPAPVLRLGPAAKGASLQPLQPLPTPSAGASAGASASPGPSATASSSVPPGALVPEGTPGGTSPSGAPPGAARADGPEGTDDGSGSSDSDNTGTVVAAVVAAVAVVGGVIGWLLWRRRSAG
ncbi:DUF1775 domain-containing protein [Streptomyces sp. NPDC000594]|uniref:DUF1775 domain-containing protein n=1 Tax=Streptomyces sp. NPDC000594 TaxID=3154261 RepID=UPI00331B7021